jgi:aldose 1-epimerase
MTGTCAEVYTFGALLNCFSKVHQGESFNVIDGFASVEEAMTAITPSFKSAKLSPFVCRIGDARFHFGEADHTLTKYSLNGSAIHGLVFDQVFTITDNRTNDEGATIVLELVYDRKDEGFPFKFKCRVEYTLQPAHRLTIKTVVTNLDDKLMPVADGWHPYFTLGDRVDNCQLEFQSKEMLEFTPGLLPTGKLLPYQEYGSLKTIETAGFDNCFTVNFAECQPLAVFRNPGRKLQVEIYPSESYPYLQLFIPPHRNSIAIENLSAYPDALNNFTGLHVLEPQQSVSFVTEFAITSL